MSRSAVLPQPPGLVGRFEGLFPLWLSGKQDLVTFRARVSVVKGNGNANYPRYARG